MVTRSALINSWTMVVQAFVSNVLLAQVSQQPKTLLERLSPINRLRAIAGLLVVLILGLVIFLVIKAGSHMFKGFSAAANRLPHDSLPKDDDWAVKPLNEPPKSD